VLADGAKIEDPDEIGTITLLLRGMITLLVPEVEALAGAHPRNHNPAICARACLGEARMRLRLGPGDTLTVRVSVAQRLARSVLSLADHYANLGGGR
jgi:hypothetical protein